MLIIAFLFFVLSILCVELYSFFSFHIARILVNGARKDSVLLTSKHGHLQFLQEAAVGQTVVHTS